MYICRNRLHRIMHAFFSKMGVLRLCVSVYNVYIVVCVYVVCIMHIMRVCVRIVHIKCVCERGLGCVYEVFECVRVGDKGCVRVCV